MTFVTVISTPATLLELNIDMLWCENDNTNKQIWFVLVIQTALMDPSGATKSVRWHIMPLLHMPKKLIPVYVMAWFTVNVIEA